MLDSDPLNGGADFAVLQLHALFTSPLKLLGFALAGTAIAVELALRWARRAVA